MKVQIRTVKNAFSGRSSWPALPAGAQLVPGSFGPADLAKLNVIGWVPATATAWQARVQRETNRPVSRWRVIMWTVTGLVGAVAVILAIALASWLPISVYAVVYLCVAVAHIYMSTRLAKWRRDGGVGATTIKEFADVRQQLRNQPKLVAPDGRELFAMKADYLQVPGDKDVAAAVLWVGFTFLIGQELTWLVAAVWQNSSRPQAHF